MTTSFPMPVPAPDEIIIKRIEIERDEPTHHLITFTMATGEKYTLEVWWTLLWDVFKGLQQMTIAAIPSAPGKTAFVVPLYPSRWRQEGDDFRDTWLLFQQEQQQGFKL